MCSSLAVPNLHRRPRLVHHVVCAVGHVLRQQIMFAMLPGTCTINAMELEVETSVIDYSRKL